ncbi:hypothetical protein OIU78_003220 [Salix suchowensis]|nr:hypothetical protein OIU78_003220 [Salix suchowensis]KAJ6362984.1 hypothetical protein OIU78_003220 [Salix suchowensis]
MSSPAPSIQDPFKAWRFLVLPTLKVSDVFSLFLKATIAICTVVSISLVVYSFLNQSQWLPCPECQKSVISGHLKITNGYVSGDFHEKTNISHILFGIGGSEKTWNKRRLYTELWWMPNITRGYVWLDQKPPESETWPETSPEYRVSADTSRFKYTCSYGSRVLDGCIDRYASFYGSDQKIQGCMSEIGVPLTKELGFHQVDIRGDPYGLLAAHPLAPLVSLHHLDYVQPIFPELNRIDSVKKLISSYKMDPGRTLQHSFCYDLTRNWTVSASWGYTIQIHPSLITAKADGIGVQNVPNVEEFEQWTVHVQHPTHDSAPVSKTSRVFLGSG